MVKNQVKFSTNLMWSLSSSDFYLNYDCKLHTMRHSTNYEYLCLKVNISVILPVHYAHCCSLAALNFKMYSICRLFFNKSKYIKLPWIDGVLPLWPMFDRGLFSVFLYHKHDFIMFNSGPLIIIAVDIIISVSKKSKYGWRCMFCIKI